MSQDGDALVASGFDSSREEETYFGCGHPRNRQNSLACGPRRVRCRACWNAARNVRRNEKRATRIERYWKAIEEALQSFEAVLMQPGQVCQISKSHIAIAVRALKDYQSTRRPKDRRSAGRKATPENSLLSKDNQQ